MKLMKRMRRSTVGLMKSAYGGETKACLGHRPSSVGTIGGRRLPAGRFIAGTRLARMHPWERVTGVDAFAPAERAALVRTRGVAEATAGVIPAFVLGVLAGAFIGLGAVPATRFGNDSSLGSGVTR